MNSLRIEADESAAKVEDLQKQVKVLEQENLTKDHEITSLTHKNSQLEGEVEKLEEQLKGHKNDKDEGSAALTQNETLQRRLQLLEEEAEEADKNLRETNDKYVSGFLSRPKPGLGRLLTRDADDDRLRQTDVKAGHFERKVQALEQDRDQWEAKFEEMAKKYAVTQKELEDFQLEIGNM